MRRSRRYKKCGQKTRRKRRSVEKSVGSCARTRRWSSPAMLAISPKWPLRVPVRLAAVSERVWWLRTVLGWRLGGTCVAEWMPVRGQGRCPSQASQDECYENWQAWRGSRQPPSAQQVSPWASQAAASLRSSHLGVLILGTS